MRFHRRFALVVFAAAVVLMAAVGTATARRLSINERQFKLMWPAPLSDSGGGEITAECAVTLEGSFHSATISKVSGALIGYIHQVGLPGRCTSGGMTVLRETLPWHIRYVSFSGTLPSITAMTFVMIGVSYLITEAFFSNSCLMRSTEANPGRFIAQIASGVVRSVRADETATIPMTGILCPQSSSGRFVGTATMTSPAGGELVIRLIQ
jgi:hypothetical protein